VTLTRKSLLAASLLVILCAGWLLGRNTLRPTPLSGTLPAPGTPATPAATAAGSTLLYAHNIVLRKGPQFRVYIRWIRGQMRPTHTYVNPSFDDPDTFVLEIEKGVIHANIGDITNYLNATAPADAPLKNLTVQPDGDLLKIHGTIHRIFALPVEITGQVSAAHDRIQLHVTHISVLKIPMKGVLGSFNIKLSDLVHTTNTPGVTLSDNDILFDTQRLLPAPHIHGDITSVRVTTPDLEIIYGNSPNDEAHLSQWHNFLKLTGGTIDFGKLTMHNADLTMIDASDDPWFNLDLVNYQAQLVHGYSRLTPQAGLEIFMPDLDEKHPNKFNQTITLDWLRNRNNALPSSVPAP
jgi:hypothetical protein